MKRSNGFGLIIMLLTLGFTASVGVTGQDDGIGPVEGQAELVITLVVGPVEAEHREKIDVSITIANQGDADSGAYKVSVYLTRDKELAPAGNDRLLGEEFFPEGVPAGETREATVKVLIPNSGLAGKYHYGAKVTPVSLGCGGFSNQVRPAASEAPEKAASTVSSVQGSFSQYTLGNDETTITDHYSGLTWQRSDDGIQRTFEEAGAYCRDLSLSGYRDWRTPALTELNDLVNPRWIKPAIPPPFICKSFWYWSSTTNVEDSSLAWAINFNVGFVRGDLGKQGKLYVRCVRRGS